LSNTCVPHRDFDDEILAASAGAQLPHPLLAVVRRVAMAAAHGRSELRLSLATRDDAAAGASVAAVRAAARHELLAVEGHDAAAAVAGHDLISHSSLNMFGSERAIDTRRAAAREAFQPAAIGSM
jgi:hypothetical protein